MAVTPDVDYFTLAGVVGAMVGDAADADKNPDWATATEGTVTLTPTVDLVHVTDTTSGKTVAMVPFPVVCTIDAQGRITYNGDLSVTLLDLGSSKVNPSVPRNKAAYNVVFAGVKMDTATVKITSFGINPSAADAGGDGSIVLWDLQPLPTSTGGAAIARGMGVPSITSATDGDVVTYDGTDIVWAAPTGGGGGGATTLDGLTDVNTSGVADGQALVYDTGTSSWSVGSIPSTPADIGAATAAQGTLADSAVQPGDLAAVATSGAYGDIVGRPTTAADLGAVPTTRTVAGHALSADVTLAKADVGLGSVDNTADTAKAVLSATKLATARTIAGQSFDGTANVTIPLSALTGLLGLAQLPAGGSFHVVSTDGGTTWKDLAGTTLAARPTSRTDVRGIFETSGSTLPAWAITGDLLFKIGT